MVHTSGHPLHVFGAHAAGLFSTMEGSRCVVAEASWVASSGRAGTPDLNMVGLLAGAAEAEVDAALGAMAPDGVVGAVLVQEGAAALDLVRERGLPEACRIPIMVWEEGDPAVLTGPGLAARPADAGDLEPAAALAAEAFGAEESHFRALLSERLLEEAELWLVHEDEVLAGMSIFTTDAEGWVGVWTMATAPSRRSRGVGRAALTVPMRHHVEAGATSFVLGATELGRPLYEKVGFRVACEPHVLIAGLGS